MATQLLHTTLTRLTHSNDRSRAVYKKHTQQFPHGTLKFHHSIKTSCLSYQLTSDLCPRNEEEQHSVAKLPYCTMVGKCMYLTNCTHPDIAFAVQELAKFMTNYRSKHYEAMKHHFITSKVHAAEGSSTAILQTPCLSLNHLQTQTEQCLKIANWCLASLSNAQMA